MLIHERVRRQARLTPDNAAMITGDGGVLSYRDLITSADALAARLAAEAAPGALVAILMRKSPAAVIAMLAALRAGLPYLPLAADWPSARQRLIAAEARPALVLADDDLASAAACLGPPCWVLGPLGQPPKAARGPRRAPAPRLSVNDLAYILYTSGSTGSPKGVMISHGNAAFFVAWACRQFPLGPADRVAVHAPLHFDLPVYDIYAGLGSGACLCLLPEHSAIFPEATFRFLRDHGATALYAVPSALHALVTRSGLAGEGLTALRQVLYAGEEYYPAPLRRLRAALPHATIANLYGPVETNVVTRLVVGTGHLAMQRIPLGTPAAGVRVALLSDDGAVRARGEAEGEILVAGRCVTPGYLNQPAQTAAVMLGAGHAAGRVRYYRTGDYALRDSAGLLHYRGRRDGLIKTRGYRVELGEIEAVLASLPGVSEVAAVATPDPAVTARLHALVIPSVPDITVAGIAARCRELLPSYMIPDIRLCGALPRTSTGKIARSELGALLARREDAQP